MTTDFDADNTTEDQPQAESLEELRTLNAARAADETVDEDPNSIEVLELPGADLAHEELVVNALPQQDDEFTCMSCFLVHHRSQRVRRSPDVCTDCS